jgi:hypothetical protein
MELPNSPEEYSERMIQRWRAQWSEIADQCRAAGEPGPGPEDIAEFEARLTNSGAAELMYEHECLTKAWAEAVQSRDPVALKYLAELELRMAKPEPMGAREFHEMEIKWAKEKGFSELYRLAELSHTWNVEQVGGLCSITRDDRAIDVREIPRPALQRYMGFYGIVGDTFEGLCKQLDATGKATVVK